jgi:hypothetical protein
MKLDGFHEVVQSAWNKQQTGSPHIILRKKLSKTAKALHAWAKPLFSNARLQLHIAMEVIFWLDKAQEDRQLTTDETNLQQDLKIRVLGLAVVERSRRRQASRINYIRVGDACMRFFHLKMSARKRKKNIASLKRQDGTIAWSHDDKHEVLHEYFMNLMGRKISRQRTFNWNNLQLHPLVQLPGIELDRPFTLTEIEQAIKAIDVLNSIFERATQDGLLTKLKGRHASMRISMYADDAVIFTNPK